MSAVLDIINPEKLKELTEKLSEGCPPHVVKWFTTTWFSWLCKQEHLLIRVLPVAHKPIMDFQLALDIKALYWKLYEHEYIEEEDGDDDDEDDEDDDEDILALEERKAVLVAQKYHDDRAIEQRIQKFLFAVDTPRSETLELSKHKAALLKSCFQTLIGNRDERVKFLPPEAVPQWAAKKFDEFKPVHYVFPAYARDKINLTHWKHVRDYTMTLPERQIRHTVPDMEKAVVEWDKALLRQKEIADLEKGTNVVKDFGNGWKVHHFVDKAAFEAEGSVMKHCIRSYANRTECMIYSLRYEGVPKFTLEVNKRYRCVVQGRGKFNSAPTEEIAKLVDEWAAEMRYSVATDAYEKIIRDQDVDDGEEEEDLNDEDDEDPDEYDDEYNV